MSEAKDGLDTQQVLKEIAQDYMKDRRRKRRWRLILRFLLIVWLSFILLSIFRVDTLREMNVHKPHTAIIEISGLIAHDQKANSDNIINALNRAFKQKLVRGIILRINSPGGSPVESDIIFHELRRLSTAYPDKKVYAVCTDACASGAYYIAAGTDKIYANPASLVGSIGVIFNGFGFVDTLKKLGIERRAITSGKNKSFLDPFSPLKDDQVALLKTMLDTLHDQFIKDVKTGRGDRLADNPEIFSGLYWTGVKAKKLGLIDDFGTVYTVARDDIGQTNIVDYTVKVNYIERFFKSISQRAFGLNISNPRLGQHVGVPTSLH